MQTQSFDTVGPAGLRQKVKTVMNSEGQSRDMRVDRRGFARSALLFGSGCALNLPDILRLRAAAASSSGQAPPDTAVIQIFLSGGPSQFETYDPKPDAPVEYRGQYRPIRTNVPGIEICETMPRQAAIMDKLTLLRSVHHDSNVHYNGMFLCLTGKRKKDEPSVGSITARMRGAAAPGLPPYVRLGNTPRKPIPVYEKNHQASYIGKRYDFFKVFFDPEGNYQLPSMAPAPGVLRERFNDRKSLLTQLDQMRRTIDATGEMETMDQFQQMAFEMVSGPKARAAFDLSQESQKLRDRYGRQPWSSRGLDKTKYHWGQAALLARRLVEAGVTFVTVDCDIRGGAFDAHQDQPRYMQETGPPMDAMISALVEDLHERGLNEKVLVLIWGEFGRSPRINEDGGRDHWGSAMSVAMAGGGLKTGQVIGSTNSRGEVPQTRPLKPEDVLATVYQHLRIDPNAAFLNHAGRPVPILFDGEPIRELR